MTVYDEGQSSSGAMLAFVCGALIGASAALLFAPMRGSDMRASIGDRTRKGRDRLREYGQTSRDWASDRVNEASEVSRAALHRATEAVDTAVDRAQTVLGQGAQRAHDATERARTAIGRGLETARTTAKDATVRADETVKQTREQWS